MSQDRTTGLIPDKHLASKFLSSERRCGLTRTRSAAARCQRLRVRDVLRLAAKRTRFATQRTIASVAENQRKTPKSSHLAPILIIHAHEVLEKA